MTTIALLLISVPVALLLYAYVLYPLALAAIAATRPQRAAPPVDGPDALPLITISVPAYNAEHAIGRTIEHLLAVDYPAALRQILIISDGSTDRTDEIVASFRDRGVEHLRIPSRGGKTRAENTALARMRGEIIVNTDATIVIPPGSVKALLRPFADPSVGVVSGRDVSIGDERSAANRGESGYLGYKMWVQGMEGRVGSITGATGSFYALRRELFDPALTPGASRDFASVLHARRLGFRSVDAHDAICLVGRAPSLAAEMKRKARTLIVGVRTLWEFRELMDPRRHGTFSLMLVTHTYGRWLIPLTLPLAVIGIGLLGLEHRAAAFAFGVCLVGALLGFAAIRWPARRPLPLVLALPGYLVAVIAGGWAGWIAIARGEEAITWEPTARRPPSGRP